MEERIPLCEHFATCSPSCGDRLTLSKIAAGDPARGSRDPLVLIVTATPDTVSAEGAAYAGQTNSRMVRLLTHPGFGIGLPPPGPGETAAGFLERNRIYRTSAVKCAVTGGDDGPGGYVIDRCRATFLTPQMRSMNNLKIVLAMGSIAIKSVFEVGKDVRVFDFVGRSRGLIPRDRRFNANLIALPHPSGRNAHLRPPPLWLIQSQAQGDLAGDRINLKGNELKRAVQLATALQKVRQAMIAAGYTLAATPLDGFTPPPT